MFAFNVLYPAEALNPKACQYMGNHIVYCVVNTSACRERLKVMQRTEGRMSSPDRLKELSRAEKYVKEFCQFELCTEWQGVRACGFGS